MRYEAKTVEEAVEGAARALGKTAAELKYTVIRDEKSFWGGRVVEIDVDEGRGGRVEAREPRAEDRLPEPMDEVETKLPSEAFAAPPSPRDRGAASGPRQRGAVSEAPRERDTTPGATDAEAIALVEATLTELLSAAGLLVEIRRRDAQGDELLFELIGDDVEPLLANKGEGLTGLEVLVGRIAAKRLGRPVHPRLDADGFRAHRKDALEELARQSAEEVRRSRRPSLLPPLAPWERRLVHLALAEDSEVETQSEGDGFLKRVEVRLKSR
ncbi:MAG: R3H domain-containing nucleic acid-binding protein [Thermoanaerobaculia bacterium]